MICRKPGSSHRRAWSRKDVLLYKTEPDETDGAVVFLAWQSRCACRWSAPYNPSECQGGARHAGAAALRDDGVSSIVIDVER